MNHSKITKKITCLLACLLFGLLLLSGCENTPPDAQPAASDTSEALVGTWLESYFNTGYVFENDGTGKDTFWDLDFTYRTEDDRLILSYTDEMWGETSYTFRLKDNTLTLQQEGSGDSYDYERQ